LANALWEKPASLRSDARRSPKGCGCSFVGIFFLGTQLSPVEESESNPRIRLGRFWACLLIPKTYHSASIGVKSILVLTADLQSGGDDGADPRRRSGENQRRNRPRPGGRGCRCGAEAAWPGPDRA